MSYYSHLLNGQMSLLWDREPVEGLLADDNTSDHLREKLELSQDIRAFARDVLKLPVGEVYTSYTDLGRPYAVWNIYAAPELSLESHTWCYPVVGCLAYRGYYDLEKAKADEKKLAAQGLETRVGGVRAYSTLGYFDDPLLSSFIFTDEAYFIELMIHEIAHRKLYIKDDTKFNENFATAVGRLGAQLWFRTINLEDRYKAFQKEKSERQKLMDLVLSYKEKLNDLYINEGLDEGEKREGKQALLNDMRSAYQVLKAENSWDKRYDNWVNNLNNAGFATLSNYQDLVPGFVELFNQSGEWETFYREVELLAELEKAKRHQVLEELARLIEE
jgi:predicted aminopeptidase